MISTKKVEGGYSSKLTYGSKLYQRASRFLYRNIPIIPSQKRYNLTICNEKKFIWFRVAKVGTRTILNKFTESNIILDAEHPYNCRYPTTHYCSYFKFAFVRNPWDRLVSCWKDKVLKNNSYHFSEDERLKMKDFRYFVDYVSKLNIKKCDIHIRLQSELIDLNNIDYLGRFENFDSDFNEILKILQIDSTDIKRKNVSNIGKYYKDYYDDELMEKVSKIYSKDIMLFSYTF